MKIKSPGRTHGIMLPPDTRKHADPCVRIFSAIERAESGGGGTNRPLSSIRARETADVALIRESIQLFEWRLPGRPRKRAQSTRPAFAAAGSMFQLPGVLGLRPGVRLNLAERQRPFAFVGISCRRESKSRAFGHGFPPAHSARKLSLPGRALPRC